MNRTRKITHISEAHGIITNITIYRELDNSLKLINIYITIIKEIIFDIYL